MLHRNAVEERLYKYLPHCWMIAAYLRDACPRHAMPYPLIETPMAPSDFSTERKVVGH